MLLNEIPAPALRVMARHLISEARKMLTRAAHLEKQSNRLKDFERSQSRITEASSSIAAQVRAGGDLDALCALYARAHQIPAESVAHHVKGAEKRHQKAERQRRDREIMRLAALGHTNDQIGERVGISRRQVQRVVSAAIQQNRKNKC